jgi:hypothetical protein
MNNYSYHLGGSLPIDSPSYVRRQNDKDLFQSLKERRFCYVLNCRQMGKSSLAIKIRQQLRDEGIACDIIPLDKVGGGSATSEQWYGGMIRSLISSFMPSESFDLRSWWQENSLLSPAMRLSEFIEKILLKKVTQSIVIFYDEVDSILSLKFNHDDFFTLTRYFYNQRAINPEFNRLTFAFLGVASPSDLIQDSTKTPFNIGQKIELEGFKLEEVSPLMEGLRGKADNPQLVMKEILSWTGGQPFLTQKLCQLVVKTGEVIATGSEAELVQNLVRQKVIENWLDQDHPQHLKTIEDRISQSDRKARLLGLYQQILEEGEVTADDSPEQMELRLSGLVVKQQGKLKVYNRIYEAVFDKNWLVKELVTLRPYSEAMIQWIASGSQENSWLLRGKALKESLDWAIKNARRHNPPDEEYLNACEEQETRRLRIRQFFQILLIFCGFLAGFIALWKAAEWQGKEKAFVQRISLGEKILTLPNISPDVNAGAGVKAFAKKDFRQAAQQLKMARERNINNPEVLIYLNNAQIGTAPAYTIAVSVPLNTSK